MPPDYRRKLAGGANASRSTGIFPTPPRLELTMASGETWQKIDTAPRDGTQIVLLVNGKAFAGRYAVIERFDNGELTSRSEGWMYGYAPLGGRPEPTHWWPLPKPPEVA